MHDKSWDVFIDRITKGIIDPQQRKQLRVELYSHLQELSDSLLSGCNNEAEAYMQALKLMGDEHVLYKMYTVHFNGWIYKLAAIQVILVGFFYYGFPLMVLYHKGIWIIIATIVNCLLSSVIYYHVGKRYGLNGITFPYIQILIVPFEILMLGTINPILILKYFMFSFIGLMAGNMVKMKRLKQKDAT